MNKTIILLITFILLLVSFTSADGCDPTYLATHTFTYYPLEETGVNYTDSANSYDFTAGLPTRTNGILDFGQDFEADDSRWLETDDSNDFKLASFTISFWFKPESIGRIHNPAGVFTRDGGNCQGSAIQVNTDNRFYMYAYDGSCTSSNVDVWKSSSSISAGNWYYITMTFSNTNDVKGYINANLDGSLLYDGTTNITYGANVDFSIGNWDKAYRTSTYSTDGIIDEVAIFDVVLNSTCIAYLNASGSPTSTQQYPFATTIDNNLTITLDYPSNNTIFYGDFLNQINVTLSNVNGTANCSIYNDTRWTVSGYDFGNETVTFINNTVIIETNFTYQIDCYDIDNYYNLTGAWFIKYNVLNISIYDDTTGDLINVSVSMNLYNDDYYQTYETTNGTIYITGLSNGTYSADFSSENYSSRGYTLTLGFGEITNLNAYLSSVDGEVILTTRDRETGAIIQGATITVKKFIDSVLTTIYTKDTDITGRIQFGYTTGVKYYFTVTKTGYENKEFILDPVIFSEYSVYLDSTATITDESDFAGVSILHTPTIFYEGMNNITVTISNPDGALINYGFNYTYLGNINGSSGSNAYGSTLQDTFNISGSSWGDKVRLTIYYRLNGESIKSYIYNYEIIPAPSNNTFMYNQNKHYGLGEFERVSIFTLMTVFIGGMFTIFTGAVSGFGVMLLMMGYFVKIGFISLWYVVIPIFAGAIILIWRVSQ